ncbi:MAG: hypothetical protein RBS43_04820 [Candidatus Cloacimonas sp.]|jgi:uncharacterized coiled-coil protein SlyX|nr:hypothetical protein [Candidatus Cloacimonas sp.]
MFDDENELLLYEDFLKLASQHPHSKGGSYIRELWEHKGVMICATELYTLYQTQFHVYLDDDMWQSKRIMQVMHQTSIPELPIKFTDNLTINDLRKFMANLRCDLAEARINNDESRITEDIATIEKLNDYILQGITNDGKLKDIDNLVRDHARLILQGVQYFNSSIQTYL